MWLIMAVFGVLGATFALLKHGIAMVHWGLRCRKKESRLR
jgi:hypothetical protein